MLKIIYVSVRNEYRELVILIDTAIAFSDTLVEEKIRQLFLYLLYLVF